MPIEAHKPAFAACCGHGWRCVMEATDRVGGGRHHHPKRRARKTRGARCAGRMWLEGGFHQLRPGPTLGPPNLDVKNNPCSRFAERNLHVTIPSYDCGG